MAFSCDALNVTGVSGITGITVGNTGSANAVNINSGVFTIDHSGNTTIAGTVKITPTSNQLILGTTKTTTINAIAPAASQTITIPDSGKSTANVVITEAVQTINGEKTFTDSVTIDISVSDDTPALYIPNVPAGGDAINVFNSTVSATLFDVAYTGTVFINPATADGGDAIDILGVASSFYAISYNGANIPEGGDGFTVFYNGETTISCNEADVLVLRTTSNNFINCSDNLGSVDKFIVNSSGAINTFATSNQITMGTGSLTTINAVGPSTNRIYTLPDFGTNATFMLTNNTNTSATTGTYTPTIYGDGGSPANPFTMTIQKGYYQRIADTCFWWVSCAWNSIDLATGNMVMSLPFVPLNDSGNYEASAVVGLQTGIKWTPTGDSTLSGTYGSTTITIAGPTVITVMYFQWSSSTGADGLIPVAGMTTGIVRCSGFYRTA